MQEILNTSWFQTIVSLVVGLVSGFLLARKSSAELQDAARTLGSDLKVTRDLLVTNMRALEGASIVDPLNWRDVEGYGRLPAGISHSLFTRREGGLEMKYIILQDEVTAGQPRVGRCVCVPEQNPPLEIRIHHA